MRKMMKSRIIRKAAGAAAAMMMVTATCGMTAWAAPSEFTVLEGFTNELPEGAKMMFYLDDSGIQDLDTTYFDDTIFDTWYNLLIPGFVGWYLTSDRQHIMYGTSTALDDFEYRYYKGEWVWLDDNGDGTAECYYFDDDGYLLINNTAPDGYATNSEGQWVSDGIVQTQPYDSSILNGTFHLVKKVRWGRYGQGYMQTTEADDRYITHEFVVSNGTLIEDSYDLCEYIPGVCNLFPTGQQSWQSAEGWNPDSNVKYFTTWYFDGTDTLICLTNGTSTASEEGYAVIYERVS